MCAPVSVARGEQLCVCGNFDSVRRNGVRIGSYIATGRQIRTDETRWEQENRRIISNDISLAPYRDFFLPMLKTVTGKYPPYLLE